MKEEDILKIIDETFDEEISSYAFESILGLESSVEGKKEFMKSVSEKLKVLFGDNDLSKF
jgi:hypothetical protein